MREDLEQKDWYKDLKIKGMTDNAGHYVEMVSIGKDKQEYYHWNDGAITTKGFKRDVIFNFFYKLIRFWKINKFLIKISFYTAVIMLIIYIFKQYI